MRQSPPHWPQARGEHIIDIWQIGPLELYEALFYRAGIALVPNMEKKVNRQETKLITLVVVFIVISALFTLFMMISIKSEEVLMKFTLWQFLRCPIFTIINDQKVMNLISGSYNKIKDNNNDKYSGFSNEVVNRLNDVVIVCQDETGKVLSVNNAFVEMFNTKESDFVGSNIKDFFVPERFKSEKLHRMFTTGTDVVYKKEDGTKVYLQFITSTVCGRRIFSGRDQTQNVLHEKLIEEEKKKSDAMLASILPAMLVPRVQAGEKNISFSVQSATVLFLDVVEFTPWCGSHDAQYVMCMLNIMFKEFDAITNAHKTMTKIKCIGDCYMAAGGIFDEVNQPAVHAKEVVDFGCLVIKKLVDIDEKENEKLRIRVGINTGGPIVAGVIGTEKPTFEILGPAINIAHEMENKGVPMKVHISRPVYELIYGQQFDIKERGEIDVKGGKMFTYLVEP